ncbi:unnamed protein product [Amoebophrya sp. A120]|nr:unnamed protein product [Amoebophrya sp. A120]|eukprot:GSA120T00012451001.1
MSCSHNKAGGKPEWRRENVGNFLKTRCCVDHTGTGPRPLWNINAKLSNELARPHRQEPRAAARQLHHLLNKKYLLPAQLHVAAVSPSPIQKKRGGFQKKNTSY